MGKYVFTEGGAELAHELGAEKLFERLVDEDLDQPLLDALTDDTSFRSSWQVEEYEQDKARAVEETTSLLRTDRSSLELMQRRFMKIQNGANWKHESEATDSNDRLFEVPKIEVFAEASEVDAYVLSGILGLQYARRHAVRSVLSKAGYENTPLPSRTDAAAHVGAWLVNKKLELETSRFKPEEPGYTVFEDGKKRTITVGGDLNGDFRMGHTTSLTDGIISPCNQPVEFGPEVRFDVAGYHSIEPHISAAMLEHALINGGDNELRSLLVQFIDVLRTLELGEQRTGPFGDFGDGDTSYLTYKLETIREKGSRGGDTVLSMPYLPHSTVMFEIVKTANGLTFRNRNIDTDEAGSGFEVTQDEFQHLFAILVEQALRGLGRTSVYQHIELVHEASKMVEGR